MNRLLDYVVTTSQYKRYCFRYFEIGSIRGRVQRDYSSRRVAVGLSGSASRQHTNHTNRR